MLFFWRSEYYFAGLPKREPENVACGVGHCSGCPGAIQGLAQFKPVSGLPRHRNQFSDGSGIKPITGVPRHSSLEIRLAR
jgi:hypothetical protein